MQKPVLGPDTVADSDWGVAGNSLAGEVWPRADAQFHRLADAMPQLLWMAQADGSRTWLNRPWANYTGLPLASCLGHGWRELIHPDDRARVARLWAQAAAGDAAHEAEYRLRRADGHYRWMLERALAQGDSRTQPRTWLGTVTDIDGLKQDVARLEENHALVRIAGRVARLGGWTIELPERKLTWSQENCAIHEVPPGYQPTLEEGIGYFLPEHRAIVIDHVEACVQHGTPYEFVLPKITARGRRIWVRSIGEAVRDEAGSIIRLQGAFQDITEQKNAQAHAMALETRLATTLESITDGFYLLDREWNFTFLNGRAEGMLKRERQFLLGKSLWREFPELVGTSMEREFRGAAEVQRTIHFETFFLTLETWFRVHAYPTEAGIAVYMQDITQQHSQQSQLQLLETAVSRVNDIVIITQAEPLDETGGRIVFVNDAFERNTGYSRHEAIGNTPKMLLGPKSRSAELDRILEAVKDGRAVRAEIASYTKAGNERWLEIDLAPIADEVGRYTHWVAVERDITERRRQQEDILNLNSALQERVQLRTSQMKVANRELEAFSYSVSHDLRSPLNTIYGFSQLLAKLDGDNVSEKGRHYLDRIRAGAGQMADLIEGLLMLANLSREQIRAENVDLSSIARRVKAECQAREPSRRAQVNIQDGLSAHGDRRLLSAVFENLLGNAWKFSSTRELSQIDVGSEPGKDGETVFFVRDNGVGFDTTFEHKLFATFERLHSPEEFSGSGIGLATVMRVIERHRGEVWAKSALNEGATFYFTLGQPMESVT
ncbi:MAG: PAS domain S-box protein [Polaromonas sp.]